MSRTRRQFLVGMGGLSLTLPWLERLHGSAAAQAAGGSGPRRVIAVTYEMGVPMREWQPQGTTNFTLPHVTAPLEPFKDRCLFVSNLDHQMLADVGSAFDFGHPAKREAALTGTATTGAFPTTNTNHVDEIRADAVTDGPANGPSVEHVIGQALLDGHPRPSINLGVDGYAGLAPYGPPPETGTSNFGFEGAANPVTLSLHPDKAFTDLFASLDPGNAQQDQAMQALRARNKSVLDAVRASFRDLAQGLGREDRRRLEDHAARIRQLELDTQLAATCSAPADPALGMTDYRGFDLGQLAPLQVRNLAHAMACGMAPVGRLEFINGHDPRFGLPDLDAALNSDDAYNWHAMVHGDPFPGTAAPVRPGRDDAIDTYDQRLLDGYRFYVQQFADLLAALDSIPEGPDQTALDHTLLVLATDLGEGLGHGCRKMGYVLAGNLGGARTGYHLNAAPGADAVNDFYSQSDLVVNQLLNSILDMAGVPGSPVIGLQGWLEQRGLPRRIDSLFS